MITARARTFLVAGAVLYFFANQTQVGWLYAMSALLIGMVLASGWLSRGILRKINAERHVGTNEDAELFESDEINIELAIHAGKTALQVRVTESCPLAALDASQRETRMFIPSLPAGAGVKFDYKVTLDRRGVHEFPLLKLETRAPFGFFEHHHKLPVSTRVLVYPEVRPLRRVDLLDHQLASQVARPKAGVGYEVMGVRPFRSGDSARDIHWRSVARTGKLIVKEYADEAQPGLTLALDLFQHPYPQTDSKHTPFEWAVKCAVSIGDYALLKGYPLHLLADDAVPRGPVNRWALLQYMARVQPGNDKPLRLGQPLQAFVAAILPWPDPAPVTSLLELHRQRIEVLAVVIDPQSFPAGGPSAAAIVDELRAAGVETRYVKFDNDWSYQLSEEQMSR
jgi:uncharacterized protein (DUF58 family)